MEGRQEHLFPLLETPPLGVQTLGCKGRTEGRVWAGKSETSIPNHSLTPRDGPWATVAPQFIHL